MNDGKKTLESVLSDTMKAIKGMERAKLLLSVLHEATNDSVYIRYVDRVERILRELNRLKEDIEFEIQIF